uniref:Uncharacterized protein n=1 Tax=Triticum urartu TaxID=4572 RepID=A0A8R7Q0G0_TRIUA
PQPPGCSTRSGLNRTWAAASSAAARTSSGSAVSGRRKRWARPGKLSLASCPRSRSAATSCATAAIS